MASRHAAAKRHHRRRNDATAPLRRKQVRLRRGGTAARHRPSEATTSLPRRSGMPQQKAADLSVCRKIFHAYGGPQASLQVHSMHS